MNWPKIIKYAAVLFAVQFAIGFLEGGLSPAGTEPSLFMLLSAAASFAASGVVFFHLAVHQSVKPFAHAWSVLLVEVAAAAALAQALVGWLPDTPPLMLAFEWLGLMCALLVGTALGSSRRRSVKHTADV